MRGAKQTIIVPKSLASTRKEAERLARRYADRLYTVRETKDSWRFRQRPPDCFVPGSFRTFCLPSKNKGRICIVYGKLRRTSEGRRPCR
jgi:hypothetical protein